MKAKILILTPVYNDWENLNKLLVKINKMFDIRTVSERFQSGSIGIDKLVLASPRTFSFH